MQTLQNWLREVLSSNAITLTPMSGDAGFRCYYRFSYEGSSYIAVDAPPSQSNNQAFVVMQKLLIEQGIIVPKIIAVDLSLGFFCLSDFGEQLFADTVGESNLQSCYQQAIKTLISITSISIETTDNLEHYDRAFVERELSIFTEWLLTEHLSITLTEHEEKQLSENFNVITVCFLEQPKVLVHRDFHSRNIMVLEDENLGIIDFQDAVIGPITYDIVSLLRDCYLKWPHQNVMELLRYFIQLISQNKKYEDISKARWERWFDLTGLQRHIKASGIFARLHHRDNKSGYLNDIPLTLSYIDEISAHYPELSFLNKLIREKVIPAMNKKTQRQS